MSCTKMKNPVNSKYTCKQKERFVKMYNPKLGDSKICHYEHTILDAVYVKMVLSNKLEIKDWI